MRLFVSIILLAISSTSIGQILSLDPLFPQTDDTVTIIYDATQGNGALVGVTPVYAHTGIITSNSATPNDWQHVQGNWGTNDASVLMTDIGNDKHMIQYHIRSFYGVPMAETVFDMAFVFRNQDGSIVGRDTDGSDIFTPVYSEGLAAVFVTPSEENLIKETGDTIHIHAAASVDTADITIWLNGSVLTQGSQTDELFYSLPITTSGNYIVTMEATAGAFTATDTFTFAVNPNVANQNPPAGSENGITYLNDSTVRLMLYAPNKDYVYVIGDFNNWQADVNYFMNKSLDGKTFWLDVSLTSGMTYAFQYFVDGSIKIGDPYSEVILDPFNDQWVPAVNWPNPHPYPTGKTTGIATLIFPGKPEYNWQQTNFTKPKKTDLVAYEMLMRDFLHTHGYNGLIDTLDYLEELGINAIQLMPVNEFEGNNSWGYNPSYHNALDKYYGTPEQFKAFIDEAHARGMAVILDVVFNHAFSQSPLCQLYWDAANFKPSPDNPWLNPDARHPFNVGYDFDHESQATKDFLDQSLRYWIEEYQIDGFRFDLSKGFTQTNSGGDVGLWGQYDASRITLLKRMADEIWNIDPETYVILEHFSDNSEETELANYGMMVWGNMNHQYGEASMGYSSDLSWGSYQVRGWNDPHLVTYMQSHDEERLMYKNLQFGNAGSNHDVKNLSTALKRIELVAAFLFTIPGPKQMWQFEELGYDYSINFCQNGTIDPNCRLDPKPIRWDYFNQINRRKLFDVYKALIYLKTEIDAFETDQFSVSLSGKTKTIHINDNSMKAVVVGNFDVESNSVNPVFQHTGWWYNYMTGDSVNITNVNTNLNLQAGEYRIYTDERISAPDIIDNIDLIESEDGSYLMILPNVSSSEFTLYWVGNQDTEYQIFNMNGVQVEKGNLEPDQPRLIGDDLPAGTYILREIGSSNVKRFVKL